MSDTNNKFVLSFRKFRRQYIISGIIAFLIGVAVFLLSFFLNGIYLKSAVDAASLSLIVLLGVAGLIYIASQGFFDIFGYGFRQMFTSMFAKGANKYNNYSEYVESKNTVRVSSPRIYVAFLLVDSIFAIATLVLFILFKVYFG